jgi:hypothetical protein
MGYTNYYYINKDNLANGIPKTYLDTMCKLKKRAKDNKVEMSFFRLNQNEVVIKGPCEWFTLESKPDPFYGDRAFRFTKTREADYDPYVKVAIMAAVNEGLVTHWSFDCYADNCNYNEDACLQEAAKIAAQIGVAIAPPEFEKL